MTKVHKLIIMVVDHNNMGVESIADELSMFDYFYTGVVDSETKEVDWDDEHPLNQTDKSIWLPAFNELFNAPKETK